MTMLSELEALLLLLVAQLLYPPMAHYLPLSAAVVGPGLVALAKMENLAAAVAVAVFHLAGLVERHLIQAHCDGLPWMFALETALLRLGLTTW